MHNCAVCQRSGTPAASKKILLLHVCEQFNCEIQADIIFVSIWSSKYCVVHIADRGTGLSETGTANQRSAEVMADLIESMWLHQHGSPAFFSADTEYTDGPMHRFLTTHNIKAKAQPVGRHIKTGIIDQNHLTI